MKKLIKITLPIVAIGVACKVGCKKKKDLAKKQKSFNEIKINPSLYAEMLRDTSLISRLTSLL